jgi:hypothetical protein
MTCHISYITAYYAVLEYYTESVSMSHFVILAAVFVSVVESFNGYLRNDVVAVSC